MEAKTIQDLIANLRDVGLPENLPYSQLSVWELRLLASVSKFLPKVSNVTDLGAGGGGSTLALAHGIKQNVNFDNNSSSLDAYDYFRTGKGTFASSNFMDLPSQGENSFRKDFDNRLHPFSEFVKVFEGDLCGFERQTAEINLLHIDIAKTFRVFKCVVRNFFPRLTPGSVVIHQDFASPRLPWLHWSTGLLLPYLEIVEPPVRSSAVLIVKKTIPDNAIHDILEAKPDQQEKTRLISEVQSHFDYDSTGKIPFKKVLELSKAFVAYHDENFMTAWEMAQHLLQDPYLATHRQDHFEQLERLSG